MFLSSQKNLTKVEIHQPNYNLKYKALNIGNKQYVGVKKKLKTSQSGTSQYLDQKFNEKKFSECL